MPSGLLGQHGFLKPDVLFEVSLHDFPAPLQHLLDPLDFSLEVLQLVVLHLVITLQDDDLALQPFFFWGSLDLSVFVN